MKFRICFGFIEHFIVRSEFEHLQTAGGWTNLSEFRPKLTRRGVGSETRPLREAMVSETTQSPHPLVVRKVLKT